MKTLPDKEISDILAIQFKDWTFENDTVKREFKFKTFVEAFSFMTAIALKAEKMNHHPDWSNSYNRVNIVLTTHDAGGITQLDLDLANSIDRLFVNFGGV